MIVERDHGITEKSKSFVLENIPRIGKVLEVMCRKMTNGEHVTTIFGSKNVMQVWGFAYGYSGEGPRGLEWLAKNLDFVPERDIFSKSDLSTIDLYSKEGFSNSTIGRHYAYFGRMFVCPIGGTIEIPAHYITKAGSMICVNYNKLAILRRNYDVNVVVDRICGDCAVTSDKVSLFRVR
jgi:hypothetical protein